MVDKAFEGEVDKIIDKLLEQRGKKTSSNVNLTET